MKKIVFSLIIVLLVLMGCRQLNLHSVPARCSSDFDFGTAKISNKDIYPQTYYLAKQGNFLFFSDVVAQGGGQTEVRIDITQRKMTKTRYFEGTKEEGAYEKGDDEYSETINKINNLTEKYLKEANIIKGYDKENQVTVGLYNDCLKRLR